MMFSTRVNKLKEKIKGIFFTALTEVTWSKFRLNRSVGTNGSAPLTTLLQKGRERKFDHTGMVEQTPTGASIFI
jgi:hypothetical protein